MSEYITIQSPRFGELQCPEDKIIEFVSPVLGFPNSTRYVISDHDKESDFKWMISVDEPEIAFVILDPTLVASNYVKVIDEHYNRFIRELEIAKVEDLLVLGIVTIPPTITMATINLLAPIMINAETKTAKQVILEGSDLSLKQPIFEDGPA